MFTKRADTRGALLGCLAGFIALLSVYLYQSGFLTTQKPAPIVSFIWFSLFGCIITLGAGLLTSKAAPAKQP
jgi:sodium-coupled monocarboxylate transporter 8/12